MRLAIVADWLPTFGGAEHVIAELHALWNDAPIYTTIAHHSSLGPLRNATIHTTPLQKWYKLTKRHEILLPWMPRAIENIDLRGIDVVLSSSHAVGKGVVPPSSAKHICYCHTPMRYAWEMEQEYLEQFRIPKRLRKHVSAKLRQLRRWDLTTAKRVDRFIANSRAVADRISSIYGRESTVVHPPVGETFFQFSGVRHQTSDYLAVGRLVPYKRFDLLIEAANKLGLPLKVVGSGSEEERLKKLAGPTVEMLGRVSDEELIALYSSSKALLFPQHEDAGIVPLEAQACGTPVIAYGKGGVLDTVKDGVTGVYFNEQSIASLSDAITRFEQMQLDPAEIRAHAEQFSSQRFQEEISTIVSSVVS